MRNLSLLLVAALGIFAVGCKPNGVNPLPFPPLGVTNGNNQNNVPSLNTNNNVPNNNNLNIPNNNNYNPTPMPQPNNNGSASIAGTYHIDTEHFNMQLHGQTPPQEQLEQMVQQLKQALSQVQLTLNADGTYQCSANGQASTGHYSINGNSLVFQEDQPSGQPLPQITIQGGQLMLHLETQAASMDLNLVR